MKKGFCILSLSAIFLASCVVLLKYAETPFAFIAFEVMMILISFLFFLESKTHKAVAFNLSLLFLMIGLAEGYYAGWYDILFGRKIDPCRTERIVVCDQGADYIVKDDARGYAATPNIRATETVRVSATGEEVYRVVYNIDNHGLRKTPDNSNASSINVLFFGCSFTYGVGVNDDETLPSLFQKIAGERFRSFNFGFHGYGAHQMLSSIERGYMADVLQGRSANIAVYQAIAEHIDRSACKYPYCLWDVNGPRYVLKENGGIRLAGKCIDGEFLQALFTQFTKSQTVKKFLARFYRYNREDIDAFIAIVRESSDVLREKYGASLHVLLWWEGKDADYVRDRLYHHGIPVMSIREILNPVDPEDETYYLHRCDRHPSEKALRSIAVYLAQYFKRCT